MTGGGDDVGIPVVPHEIRLEQQPGVANHDPPAHDTFARGQIEGRVLRAADGHAGI